MKITPINMVFIIIMIISFSLLGYTVSIAMNNPIHMENVFLDDYKSVDNNYEKIEHDSIEFDANVDFTYNITNKNNKKHLSLNLASDKYTKFDVIARLTRPHTNKDNANLNIISSTDNNYIFDIPSLLKGKWRIIAKIQTQNLTAYKNIDFKEPLSSTK